MKLFQRKQPQPIINDPYNQDTVAMAVPATTTMPTVKPVVPGPSVQVCACCGTPLTIAERMGNKFTNGDLYLKRLEHNYLCDACHAERERCRNKHNVANHKTVLEHQAVKKQKLTGGVIRHDGPIMA